MKPLRIVMAGLVTSIALINADCGGQSAGTPAAQPPAPLAAESPPPKPDLTQPVPSARTFPDGNMDRAKVPDEYKWRLEDLFASDEAFDEAVAKASAERKKLIEFRGKLSNPKKLAECLALYFDTRLLTNKLTLYANQRFDSDQQSTKLQSMYDRSLDSMNELMASASFIRQEVLAIDEKAMKKAYGADPKLGAYRPYLDELRRRRSRVLHQDAERALALLGDNLWAEIDLNELPSDHEKSHGALLADIALPQIQDESGQPVQLTLSNYGKYRSSPDRGVRQRTVESFFTTLKLQQHVFASTLSGQVRHNIALARSRGYETALDAYLDKDNIERAVYENLIRSIHANLEPVHKYVRLRKQVMGLSEIHIYDLYPPMIKGTKMEYPYPDAQRIIPEALAPLGDEYLSVLRRGLDPKNGWIDVFPHKNKKSGAFSSSVFGIHPYVKMNYYNEGDDLSTLAHEYGHALHSHLAMTSQPYVTANYVPFVAEIASTLNEKLLSDYLLAHAKSDEEKLSILNELVETIRTTIYRQTMFAEFELAIHSAAEKGTPLTAEFLNKTYGDLLRKYYGPDFTIGPNDDAEWAYIPHFYFKYYVYAYATGLSSGIALADLVKTGPQARDAYLGMLKGGSSKPPLELLRTAGVDLTKPQAIESSAKLLDQTLDQIQKLLSSRKQ